MERGYTRSIPCICQMNKNNKSNKKKKTLWFPQQVLFKDGVCRLQWRRKLLAWVYWINTYQNRPKVIFPMIALRTHNANISSWDGNLQFKKVKEKILYCHFITINIIQYKPGWLGKRAWRDTNLLMTEPVAFEMFKRNNQKKKGARF